jgi:hypothetical protein
MYYILWNNKEIIDSNIESYDEAMYLSNEYYIAYGGTISIECEA